MIKHALVVFAVSFAVTGCTAQHNHPAPDDDDARIFHMEPGSSATYDAGEFRQIGLMLYGDTQYVEARVDGGPWRPVEITWDEDRYQVARLLLDEPGHSIELRSDKPWEAGTVQFYEQIAANVGDVLARDLPYAEPEIQSRINAIAPADLVISRAQWGARNPNKVCGSPHTPSKIAIHHTAVPADDGGDAAARMRGMQAYHIDSNGWCDIGYHFVVSQAGKVYQGWSDEQRVGTHVYNNNTNNIGICFIGNFQSQQVGTAQLNAGASILGWVARTYNIPFNRTAIKGHREHPQNSTTSCPGTNLLNSLPNLISLAQTPVPTEPSDVAFEVNWLGEMTDLYDAGSSAGKPDVFEGDTLKAEIRFTNTTSGPLRNVALSYWFEAPHLAATNYVIESDAPGFNGSTFGVNDSNDNPDNPARDAMGQTGTLGLYAMASRETKRVVIDLVAKDYSIGLADHPDVRGWIKHLDNMYGEQNAYDQEPTNNNAFEGLLQGFAQLDVLSQKEWQFDGGEPEQHEGWSTCSGEAPVVDVEAGALTATLAADGCLNSPVWTSIDASTWNQLVLRVDVPTEQKATLFWTPEGQDFSEQNAVTFALNPGANTYLLDLREQAGWSGVVSQLRFVPGATTVSIDAVFVQSSDGEVGSSREDWVDAPPVEFGDDVVEPPTSVDPPVGGNNNGNNGDGGNPPGVDVPEDPTEFRTNKGCATAADGGSAAPLFILLGMFAIRRRRR